MSLRGQKLQLQYKPCMAETTSPIHLAHSLQQATMSSLEIKNMGRWNQDRREVAGCLLTVLMQCKHDWAYQFLEHVKFGHIYKSPAKSREH